MSVTTTYAGTLVSPSCDLGFNMRPETTVKIGEARKWATGGLETTSWIYDVYEASVGLQAGSGITLGCLNALNFAYEPDRSPMEVINIADSPGYELVGEECTVSIDLFEWNADVIALIFGSGQYHTIVADTDRVIRFGGGCAITSRPLVIEGLNVGCNISGITDLTDGIEAFVITLYDCLCTSGFNVDFDASENTSIATEWQVVPVTTLEAGNRLGNIYMYAD